MNHLLRGVARSGCPLRWTSRSTPAASSAAPRWRPPTAAPRPFSSLHAAVVNVNGAASEAGEAAAPRPPRRPRHRVLKRLAKEAAAAAVRPPSALERARLKDPTPGRALHALHRYTGQGLGFVRQADFVRLCDWARPGKLTDGRTIATALREFKTNNRFVVQTVGARAAVAGMLRAKIPTWKVQDGKPRVRAAVFVAEQILDARTGLYFAVETATVDKVLEELRKGLVEMERHGLTVKVDNAGEDGEGEGAPSAGDQAEGEGEGGASAEDQAEGGEQDAAEGDEREASAEEKLAREALRVTEEVTQLLIKRKTRPERDLKKRARRKYLKLLQVGSGPHHATMSTAAQIAVLVGDSARARREILAPYDAAWWSGKKSHARCKGRVERLIAEAAALEEAARAAGDAPAAAAGAGGAAAAGEGASAEGGDGGDGDDAGEGSEKEGASEQEGEAAGETQDIEGDVK